MTEVKLTKEDWEDLKKSAVAGLKRSMIDVKQYTSLLTLCDKHIEEFK